MTLQTYLKNSIDPSQKNKKEIILKVINNALIDGLFDIEEILEETENDNDLRFIFDELSK